MSIVCYASKEPELKNALVTLLAASAKALLSQRFNSVDVLLIDNGPTVAESHKLDTLIKFLTRNAPAGIRLSRIGDGRNVGFGAGHNLAFAPNECAYHLVLNPDVELDSESLIAAVDFMEAHPDCGVLAPAIFDQYGERQYLCKRFPTVLDLLLRGFAPVAFRRLFQTRLDYYEMRDAIAEKVVWGPQIVSGCFMLLRSSVLAELQGFDQKYFLYFEDFDLSLRAANVSRLAYVPSVRIIHYGGKAARKGFRHISIFVQSAMTFFNSHGWRWL